MEPLEQHGPTLSKERIQVIVLLFSHDYSIYDTVLKMKFFLAYHVFDNFPLLACAGDLNYLISDVNQTVIVRFFRKVSCKRSSLFGRFKFAKCTHDT